jgi:hypothetical protein
MNCSSESALICLPETKCACALVIVVATWTALRALVAGALTLVGLSDLVGLVRVTGRAGGADWALDRRRPQAWPPPPSPSPQGEQESERERQQRGQRARPAEGSSCVCAAPGSLSLAAATAAAWCMAIASLLRLLQAVRIGVSAGTEAAMLAVAAIARVLTCAALLNVAATWAESADRMSAGPSPGCRQHDQSWGRLPPARHGLALALWFAVATATVLELAVRRQLWATVLDLVLLSLVAVAIVASGRRVSAALKAAAAATTTATSPAPALAPAPAAPAPAPAPSPAPASAPASALAPAHAAASPVAAAPATAAASTRSPSKRTSSDGAEPSASVSTSSSVVSTTLLSLSLGEHPPEPAYAVTAEIEAKGEAAGTAIAAGAANEHGAPAPAPAARGTAPLRTEQRANKARAALVSVRRCQWGALAGLALLAAAAALWRECAARGEPETVQSAVALELAQSGTVLTVAAVLCYLHRSAQLFMGRLELRRARASARHQPAGAHPL